MGIEENFKSLFVDNYRAGVEYASDLPVIYIDPDEFDLPKSDSSVSSVLGPIARYKDVTPEHVEHMREILNGQYPGYADSMDDDDIKLLVVMSQDLGAFAMPVERNGANICLVNMPKEGLLEKNSYAAKLSSTDVERLKETPGWQEHWNRLIGMHEGAHCNQGSVKKLLKEAYSTEDFTERRALLKEVEIIKLGLEAGADRKALAWMKENGLNDIAQAYTDYRALGAADMKGQDHAVSIFLHDDKPINVTAQHLKAIEYFRYDMVSGVGKALGITHRESDELFNNNPEKFINTVDKLLEEGGFDGGENPYIKEYIRDYTGAYRRQILGKLQEPPEHNGGHPEKSKNFRVESDDGSAHYKATALLNKKNLGNQFEHAQGTPYTPSSAEQTPQNTADQLGGGLYNTGAVLS